MKSFFIILLLIYIVRASFFDTGFDLDIDEPINLLENNERRKDKSEGLQEFTPIRNSIGQSETQYYSFSVNTTSGLGLYYQFLIFLTGNICSQPANVNASDPSLAVYYSFNASMFQNFEISHMELFKNGYFQALADVPISESSENKDSILYIAVRAPENTNISSIWTYEIGVSQNDLVFQWDDRTWATLVDTDDDSALIVTGNLTMGQDTNYTTMNATKSQYSLSIYSYDYRHYFASLNSSWCAIRNGPALFSMSNFESSYTNRGGGLQQQFYVTGLNSSTKYVAYLISDFGGNDFGGVAYQPFEFETLDKDACDLIYDLDFCNQVAYSVPANSAFTKNELKTMYDDRAKSLFSNFTKALQQIACNTTKDAIFSPVRTCDDCAESYKNWLCSVTIPRCSTRNITGYKERSHDDSRNDFINEKVKPDFLYFEVLPCVNVCQAIVRDCPADFNFQCPKDNKSIELSYYWDNGGKFPTCNYVGNYKAYSSLASKVLLDWRIYLVFIALLL
ncbi:uncharacterized protein PRCAT00003561001 [Priceomyces carsonii]|uniref:uncharacterized protein n=1 Tax=Priceomyces carsonii TaxID=28549 RepID=UPI002ED7BB51|nr:unnamed protein product [Priceomyces carsonii]